MSDCKDVCGDSCSESFRDVKSEATTPVQRRSAAFQGGQQRSQLIASHEKCQTKPTPPHAELTSRQLAAARLLCHGLRTVHVASRLDTTVQTINRWRKLPSFARELARLHDL